MGQFEVDFTYETHDKIHILDRSFEENLNNQGKLLNSALSPDYSNKQFNGLSPSTFHELKKSNPFRVIFCHTP